MDTVETIILIYCPSLIHGNTATSTRVLGPPLTCCLNCNQNLVHNHVTDIKIYSFDGVDRGKKVTLRCKDCKLLYNYSQFGNKHDQGFRFYSEPQPYIEVSDTVYFDRGLHELQCCLAYVGN